jgi:hypothetical protein
VERGNAKHSPREDEALEHELSGMLGRGGSNREEWADPEGPADDDPEVRVGPVVDTPASIEAAREPAADDDDRVQHDLAVANDWHDEDSTPPGAG